MRVLWVCNIMLPVIAKQLGISYSNKEGWLTGLSQRILSEEENGITLGVCFPSDTPLSGKLTGKELYYYSFCEDMVHEECYDPSLETSMTSIMEQFKPDIVHCFGTEYGHTYAAVKAFGRPDRTLIGLQGICHACAQHYLDGIPENVAKRTTFRDFIKKDNLLMQKQKMAKRGERESSALKRTGHVTGRTEFDRKAVSQVNSGAVYHFMNETMRSNFYGSEWSLVDCEKHSIFVSQGNYPIKGLHFMLRALPLLKERYPDVHLYVAGDNIVRENTLIGRMKISSYGKYIRDLINEGNIREQVTFLGPLDADSMCERFLKSHVFASVSTIENSPNSVGEAMLLGVPVVSSRVGGVPDMLTDEEEGLLYETEDTDALVHAISRIFEDDALTQQLSAAARIHARRTHDADVNFGRLLEIYHDIDVYQ